MSWILLKANNGHQASGMGDKIYFSVLSELCSICEQPLYGIKLIILHANKWCILINGHNFQIFFRSNWKIPNASGHSCRLFTSCLTGAARVQWLWVNEFSHNEYHIWQAWPSTYWHVGKMLQKYKLPVFTAQTRNHWQKWKKRASILTNGLLNWYDYILCPCQ